MIRCVVRVMSAGRFGHESIMGCGRLNLRYLKNGKLRRSCVEIIL